MTCEEHVDALVAKNPRLGEPGNVTLPALKVLHMVEAAYWAGRNAAAISGDSEKARASLDELRKLMGMTP